MYHDAEPAGRSLGPESLLWQYAGDTRIAFLGGTIGLLQLMHPAIGAGVIEHSNFFEDPFDRVFRSLPAILGAVYDADADDTGRWVRDQHTTIKGVDPEGRRYHALDPETYWWAHATFQFMAEQVVDRFDDRRLSTAEREQLYEEGLTWYRRYGVSDRRGPDHPRPLPTGVGSRLHRGPRDERGRRVRAADARPPDAARAAPAARGAQPGPPTQPGGPAR